MDAVFKALSDATRRQLLDALRERDGQTLTELESGLGMTRFGVMKHLKILEAARLVTSRKSGRFKHHYLNAVPLQAALDRWVEPFRVKPLAQQALDIKTLAEGATRMTQTALKAASAAKPDVVLETFIAADADAVWEALTSSEISKLYHFMGAEVRGEPKVGGRLDQFLPDGSMMIGMEVLACDPPRLLEMSFEPHWAGPDVPLAHSRCRYEIEAQGATTKFTILHFDVPEGQEGIAEGWAKVASALKTYLETGKTLELAAPGAGE
jgi:uncharacterized protein YndB with AHSA1/START domain/DNA-binding transcriptional ArsR family regulator